MTTWTTTPCDTSSCIQTRTVGDRVEIRDSEYPEVVLSVPAEAWEAFEAAIEARGYARAVEALRDTEKWAAYMIGQERALYDEQNTDAADYLEAQIERGEMCTCGVPLASHQCTHCHDDPPRGHICPRCARPAGHVGPWRPVDTEETKP